MTSKVRDEGLEKILKKLLLTRIGAFLNMGTPKENKNEVRPMIRNALKEARDYGVTCSSNFQYRVGQRVRNLYRGAGYGVLGTIVRVDEKDIIVKTDDGCCPTLDWRYVELVDSSKPSMADWHNPQVGATYELRSPNDLSLWQRLRKWLRRKYTRT